MAVAITSTGPIPSYTEGDPAAPIDGTLTVTDSGSLTGASVVISSGYLAGDLLTYTAQSGISAGYDNGILTLSGVASASVYQTLLASVAFSSTSDDPTQGGSDPTRTVTFTASDPSSTSNTTQTVDVVAVDDAPTAIAPASYSGVTAQPLDLKNTGLSVADVDGDSNVEAATLSVSQGSLSVTAGGSGATVTVNDAASVSISGTVAQIDALLNSDATSSVSYVDLTANASVALLLQISDLGHTGGSTSLTDSAFSHITIADAAPSFPPPVVSVDPDVSVFGSTVTLTGEASAAGGLAGVELFEGTLDVGPATLSPDGTWSFDFHNGAGLHTGLTAIATDDQGQQTTAPSDFDLTTGVAGQPYRVVLDHFDPTSGDYLGSTYYRRFGVVLYESTYTALPSGNSAYTYANGSFFNSQTYSSFTDTYDSDGNLLTYVQNNNDGSHLISAIADFQTVVGIGNDTFAGDGSNERFVFKHGVGDETIADFQVGGPGHDKVSLPASAAGRLGEILAQGYGDGQGDTTINIGRGDTITFLGVTKAELRAHPNDFTLHA